MAFVYTAALVLAMLLSVTAGWWLRQRLREKYLSADKVDSIRLLMGMLLTFSALVLGLLTSNAKERFDGLNDSLSAFSADLIELDHRLRNYGPGADDIRALLRSYTAAAIADSWPAEPAPSGQYPHFDRVSPGVEGKQLGDMLTRIDVMIENLSPGDLFHQQIAGRLRDRIADTVQVRWHLIFASRSTISWPFLLTLTTWLAIIFAIFGMTSPRDRVVYAVVGLSALSIASPLYLIIDYDQALSGQIQLASEPMRAALQHMDEP